ncbi:unnamed protein product [Effrenium voratum]|nr:unnamed protein product [Effrenium voratum]
MANEFEALLTQQRNDLQRVFSRLEDLVRARPPTPPPRARTYASPPTPSPPTPSQSAPSPPSPPRSVLSAPRPPRLSTTISAPSPTSPRLPGSVDEPKERPGRQTSAGSISQEGPEFLPVLAVEPRVQYQASVHSAEENGELARISKSDDLPQDKSRGTIAQNQSQKSVKRRTTARAKDNHRLLLVNRENAQKLKTRRTVLQRLTSHMVYENVMGLLIFANALILGLQVHLLAEEAARRAALQLPMPEVSVDVFFGLHWVFCVVFSLDLSLRWISDGFFDFFTGIDAWWNAFDVFVVAFAIVDVVMDTVFIIAGDGSTYQSRRSFSVLRMLRVVRIIRVLRVVRMFTFFRELRMMIHSTIHCFRAVFFVMLIFLAMLYVFGIAFTSAFVDQMSHTSTWQDPSYAQLIQFFGGVTVSGLSLYQAMAGGRDWHVFYDALSNMDDQVWKYIFLFYTLIAIFAIVNIVAAVFVDTAVQFSKADHQLMVHQEVTNRRELLASLGELFGAIDIDDNGFITREEFHKCLTQEKFMAFFRAIKLDYRDAQLLFDLLDAEKTGKVTEDEFVEGCAGLHGEATALETKVLHQEVQVMKRQLDQIVALVRKDVRGRRLTHESSMSW